MPSPPFGHPGSSTRSLATRWIAGIAIAAALLACDSVSPPARAVQLDGIPLVELPATRPGGQVLALVLSGDGDWAELIDGFSRILADSGIAVIGVRSRSYLSAGGRNADSTARDMAVVLRAYLERWKRDEIVIAGYSRGADLAPFIVARLPDDLRQRVRLIALLSPAISTNFRFHLTDLVKTTHRPSDVPLLPELMSIRGVPILCVYGRSEPDSLCPSAPAGRMHVVVRSGGHRTTDFRLLARLVIDQLAPPGVGDTMHRVGDASVTRSDWQSARIGGAHPSIGFQPTSSLPKAVTTMCVRCETTSVHLLPD